MGLLLSPELVQAPRSAIYFHLAIRILLTMATFPDTDDMGFGDQRKHPETHPCLTNCSIWAN